MSIKEIAFPGLGYFTDQEIEGLAAKLNGKSYMNFVVKSGNYAGNHTLIVQVEGRDESLEVIKRFFLACALVELSRC